MAVNDNEPEWELDCRCPDCEYQRSFFGLTFAETQAKAKARIDNSSERV